MKTLHYCPLLITLALLSSCGEEEPVAPTTPSTAALELIMDGERGWRAASVRSDKPLDFDGVETTDWYAQMRDCRHDDPIVMSYDAGSVQTGPDFLNMEVFAGEGMKCSQFEVISELLRFGAIYRAAEALQVQLSEHGS